MVFVVDLTSVQSTPLVELNPWNVLPERTRRTQALGRLPAARLLAAELAAVLVRSCQRNAPSGERPKRVYVEPRVRLSRIIRPKHPLVPVLWIDLSCALISPSALRG